MRARVCGIDSDDFYWCYGIGSLVSKPLAEQAPALFEN